MDLYVRDVDPVAMKKLSELAKRKKISRPEYIRQFLHHHAVMDEVNAYSDKYDRLVQTLLQVVTNNTEQMERIALFLEKEETK